MSKLVISSVCGVLVLLCRQGVGAIVEEYSAILDFTCVLFDISFSFIVYIQWKNYYSVYDMPNHFPTLHTLWLGVPLCSLPPTCSIAYPIGYILHYFILHHINLSIVCISIIILHVYPYIHALYSPIIPPTLTHFHITFTLYFITSPHFYSTDAICSKFCTSCTTCSCT